MLNKLKFAFALIGEAVLTLSRLPREVPKLSFHFRSRQSEKNILSLVTLSEDDFDLQAPASTPGKRK